MEDLLYGIYIFVGNIEGDFIVGDEFVFFVVQLKFILIVIIFFVLLLWKVWF